MKPYNSLAELIKNLEDEIETLTKDVSMLKEQPQSLNAQIIFKYIDTGSTGKTKDYVRSLGVKSEFTLLNCSVIRPKLSYL